MSLDGSCECGAVRYRINAVHLHIYACHCLNCQKRSGSAFALHTMLPAAVLDCEGQTVSRERSSNGILFEELFCEMCLCRLFNRNDALPGMLFLRAGTLEASASLAPIAHIWIKRKQPWIKLPDGMAAFEESPTPEQFSALIQAAELRNQS